MRRTVSMTNHHSTTLSLLCYGLTRATAKSWLHQPIRGLWRGVNDLILRWIWVHMTGLKRRIHQVFVIVLIARWNFNTVGHYLLNRVSRLDQHVWMIDSNLESILVLIWLFSNRHCVSLIYQCLIARGVVVWGQLGDIVCTVLSVKFVTKGHILMQIHIRHRVSTLGIQHGKFRGSRANKLSCLAILFASGLLLNVILFQLCCITGQQWVRVGLIIWDHFMIVVEIWFKNVTFADFHQIT